MCSFSEIPFRKGGKNEQNDIRKKPGKGKEREEKKGKIRRTQKDIFPGYKIRIVAEIYLKFETGGRKLLKKYEKKRKHIAISPANGV